MAYRRREGSLTIEAAMLLPAFLAAAIMLLSIFYMTLAGMRLQEAVVNEAAVLSAGQKIHDGVTLSSVKDDIAGMMPKESLRFIENGADGLDMSGSVIDDGEYVDLIVSCELIPATDLFGIIKVQVKRRCLAHMMCGYENGYFPDGEYVYIADDSEVYHSDRNCSHIRLTVMSVSGHEIGALRNNSGSRYRPCELCRSSIGDDELYITPEGDRYHNRISCSGLKRTVRVVRKSEAGDRRPCSRCGR